MEDEIKEIEVTQICPGLSEGGTREERAKLAADLNATSAQVAPREVCYNSPATVTSPGLRKWRRGQKPGAIMKSSTFKKIEKKAAAAGATDPEKVAGKAYWTTAKAKFTKSKKA